MKSTDQNDQHNDDHSEWESRELGASEAHARRVTTEQEAEVNQALERALGIHHAAKKRSEE